MRAPVPSFSPDKVFIIAEAGVNHDGLIERAFELVDAAKAAGADAVKFQTFKPGEVTGRFAVKVDYLDRTTEADEDRFELSARLALGYDAFREIKAYCEKVGILFLTTPDGRESLDFVHNELDIPIIKVGSTEVTHLTFLEAVAKTGKPIIFSTGLSKLGEVERALDTMLPHNRDITVLHCTSEYPAPVDEVNLKAMQTLASAFGLPVGFSDHTVGLEAPVAAVALGATVIEKHFTVDKTLPGPDHQASLSPEELAELVKAVRKTERLLGDGIKRPSASESRNEAGIRRSVVAARAIKKGAKLVPDDLTFKRPGTGVHPYDVEKIIGMTVNRDFVEDEPIGWDDLK